MTILFLILSRFARRRQEIYPKRAGGRRAKRRRRRKERNKRTNSGELPAEREQSRLRRTGIRSSRVESRRICQVEILHFHFPFHFHFLFFSKPLELLLFLLRLLLVRGSRASGRICRPRKRNFEGPQVETRAAERATTRGLRVLRSHWRASSNVPLAELSLSLSLSFNWMTSELACQK